MKCEPTLIKEFEYYLENQEDFVQKYRGKFVVIKGREVIGVYEDEIEAISKAREHHEVGTFLVQKCEPGSEGYSQNFHSRVAFA